MLDTGIGVRGLIAAVILMSTSTGPAGAQTVPWVGSWGTAPAGDNLNSAGSLTLNQQTLRQIVHTSIGGSAARIHLSNFYGKAPLVISDVHVALSVSNTSPQTVAGSDKAVTFGGAQSITIPAGGSIVSDSVAFIVPPLSDVAISLFFPGTTRIATPVTLHEITDEVNFWAAGDVSGQQNLTAIGNADQYYFLTGLDVQQSQSPGAVVTFGASITAGDHSTFFANHRWPNFFAQRLAGAKIMVGVLNEGISGDRLLTDNGPFSDSGLSRFNRDAVTQPGARWVIVSDLPLNDLGGQSDLPGSQLISGLQTLIAQAHSAGLRYICSTMTPWKNSAAWNTTAEAGRGQVNDFIRSSGSGCDAIVDQAQALADVDDPQLMLEAFDSGDELHPNDVGYRVIANAVDLTSFGAGSSTAPLVQDGTYSLLVHKSGLVLDDPGFSTQPGTVLNQWTRNGGANQHWILKNLGGNVVSLINEASGLALEVAGGSTANGAPVDQAPYIGSPSQQWRIESVGSGYYQIINVNSSQVLDVAAGSRAAGAAVGQFPYHAAAWQQWTFVN
jgi:lysophospholipase L1-like esterase